MKIQHKNSKKEGLFYMEIEGYKKASMTYNHSGNDTITIDHTEVDVSLKGEGVGYMLVEAAVIYAREKGLKIIPLCPYVNAVFKKKTEYNDVLS